MGKAKKKGWGTRRRKERRKKEKEDARRSADFHNRGYDDQQENVKGKQDTCATEDRADSARGNGGPRRQQWEQMRKRMARCHAFERSPDRGSSRPIESPSATVFDLEILLQGTSSMVICSTYSLQIYV